MLSTERHFFVSRMTQRELPPQFVLPVSEVQRGEEIILMVPIRLRLFKLFGRGRHRWFGDATNVTYDSQPVFVNEVGINFNLSHIKSRRRKFRDYMARHLTSLGVPKLEQPAILRKIAEVVDVAVPHLPVSLIIVDVTVELFGEATTALAGIIADFWGSVTSSETTIDAHTWEFMETHIHEPMSIPATKAFIEGLEYLGLGELEEDFVRQASQCDICLEELVQSDSDLLRVLTRLPCSHLYHRACVVEWLEKSHLCPLWQYAMPTEERKELTEPSWTLNWPMLLIVAAGGVMTATLVCRLWKRSQG